MANFPSIFLKKIELNIKNNFKKLFSFLNKSIFFQKNGSFVFWRMSTEKYIFLILMMRKNIQGFISIILALLFIYFISLKKLGAF